MIPVDTQDTLWRNMRRCFADYLKAKRCPKSHKKTRVDLREQNPHTYGP